MSDEVRCLNIRVGSSAPPQIRLALKRLKDLIKALDPEQKTVQIDEQIEQEFASREDFIRFLQQQGLSLVQARRQTSRIWTLFLRYASEPPSSLNYLPLVVICNHCKGPLQKCERHSWDQRINYSRIGVKGLKLLKERGDKPIKGMESGWFARLLSWIEQL